jgi:signal transduction histidine kinase
MAFLGKVVGMYDNIFDMHEKDAAAFQAWLRGLVLFEPNTELYLLAADGTVLAKTGPTPLKPGTHVALAPVRESIERMDASFVMGDDPERMDADAVVAAEPLRGRAAAAPAAGYLYLVAHRDTAGGSRWEALRSTFALPSLVFIAVIVGVTTLLAALVIASVTRPLQRLTDAVASLSLRGLEEGTATTTQTLLPATTRDEFGQLTAAFEMMLATLRRQWGALRRLDHFRREGVSNLSHDLRSPLTATAACLETLDARWSHDAGHGDDRRLLEVALRNTRNAARLVQSLGDLARLDEPEFKLRAVGVDVDELLDDIRVRFAERAQQHGVELRTLHPEAAAPGPWAELDVELFERAVANLIDNALKFCPRGALITLGAVVRDGRVEVCVEDSGPGIPAADVPHLFDRFFQSRHSVAPATGEGGKGLGLAIVKRIVELHGGEVAIDSALGRGTRVVLRLPAAVPAAHAGSPGEIPHAGQSTRT